MCQRASELLKEFHDVYKIVPQMVVRSSDSRWKPPASGVYKFNLTVLYLRSRLVQV